ncbi:MAG: TonB-dependent receptor [Alphaproteobacteria bacterium]|nr:TonB-dependent receptor [Alphaproteobacteria bacterium]
MKLNILAILVGITSVFSQSVLAQDTFELDPIIVSGGLTPIKESKYGRSASVLTNEEIEQRGITTVQNALLAVPGISVIGLGNSFIQVRIRGAEANHTLILIDGIPAAGGNGEYILSGLEIANIERIEVLRGPQSVFYGSNASAGMINIITKKGKNGTEYGGSVKVGNGHSSTARYSFRTERGGIAVNLSHLDDDGYDYSGSNGEKDGITGSNLNLSGDYMATKWLKLGFTFRNSEEDYAFDSNNFSATTADDYVIDDPNQNTRRIEWLGNLYAEYEGMDRHLTHRLSLKQTDFEHSINSRIPTKTNRLAAKYLLSFGIDGQMVANTDHLMNAMLEWERDTSSTNPNYERESNSVALEYRGSLVSGLSYQAGIRYDNKRVFEDNLTWTLSAGYTFEGSGIRVHSSSGTGVVDPSYFELFANSFGFVGNSNLRTEKNSSFDLGIEVPVLGGRGVIDVTLFHDELTDEITSLFDSVSNISTYINQTGNSKRQGIELSVNLAATDSLDLQLNYTYLDAINPDGSVEIHRPQHELLLSITQQIFCGRGNVTVDLRYVAGNYDSQFFSPFGRAKLSNYMIADMSAQYELNDRIVLTVRVNNLFNKEYSDVRGYAKQNRIAYIGLRAAF